MLYCNKDLINILGFKERTFYRRLEDKKVKKKTEGIYMSESEALALADQLGFKKEFENYIKQNPNGKASKK